MEDDENIPRDDDIPDDEDIPPYKPMDNIPSTSSSTPIRIGINVVEGAGKKLKIEQLYKFLGVEGNSNVVDIDRCKMTRNSKTGHAMLYFFKDDGEKVNLTKISGEFRTANEIKRRMGELEIMKGMLGLDDTPPLLEKSIQAARDLNKTIPTDLEMEDIPLEDLSTRIQDVDVGIQKASKDTGLPVRELLALDKTLQRIQGELANNVGKLGEIKKHITKEKNKLKDIGNDSSYTDQQRDEVKQRIKDMKEEHSARNRKELSSNFARMRQTLEKIADSDTSLKERIKTLFREQGLTITAVLTAIGMTISTIILAIKNAFGMRGGSGKKPPSNDDPDSIKNWVKGKLNALARLLGKLGSKALAALPSIIGSIISWVLNMLKKGVEFAAQHVYAFITFVCGIVGYWIYSR